MPNCVVKGCKNQSSRNKKHDSITFHKFPNKAIEEKWIEVIRLSRNEPSWNPTVHSVVCSQHFDDDDFYYTNKGLRRVVRNGYPKVVSNVSIILEPNIGPNEKFVFPSKDQYTHIKEKWIEFIRASRHEPLWLPNSKSVVCSAHFEVEDLYNTQTGRCLVLHKGYPKIFPVIPERLQRKYLSQTPDVHQPAAPTQSDDLLLEQPISCSNDDIPFEEGDYRSVSNAFLSDNNRESDRHNDIPELAKLTTVRVQSEQISSNFDILKKHKLLTRVLRLQKKLTQKKKKIKALNQNVRRLQKRNQSLKKELRSLQNRNYGRNTDALNRKKLQKKNVLKTT